MNPYDQSDATIRCEWSAQGVAALAPISDVVIIVDVLSFSTCVEVAASRGAIVFPYRGTTENAAAYAASLGAELAGKRGTAGAYSLSPASLQFIPVGTRLVLPSPNGATLSLGTGNTGTLAGCLRNATAVASTAQAMGKTIAVIPAGERWRTDGSLRPAFEDWVGAGAIISQLRGILSPEAQAAVAAFRAAEPQLSWLMANCASGKELIDDGFGEDVAIASMYDVSTVVPRLVSGGYVAH